MNYFREESLELELEVTFLSFKRHSTSQELETSETSDSESRNSNFLNFLNLPVHGRPAPAPRPGARHRGTIGLGNFKNGTNGK
jgi:hypothetical protein